MLQYSAQVSHTLEVHNAHMHTTDRWSDTKMSVLVVIIKASDMQGQDDFINELAICHV